MSSPSTSSPSGPFQSPSDRLRTLRQLYSLAARAFLTRSPLVHSYIDQAFRLLHPPKEGQNEYDSSERGMGTQRVKWDVLRLTLEASVYPLQGNGRVTEKGKDKSKGHGNRNGAAMGSQEVPDVERSLLTLSPPLLLPALCSRSVSLFTPTPLKPSIAYLPPDVLLALVLFAVKFGLKPLGREYVERWWVACGDNEQDSDEEVVSKRKIRECMVLRVCAGMDDWEGAEAWVEGEEDAVTRDQLRASLESLRNQSIAEKRTDERPSLLSNFTAANILPQRTPPRTGSSSSIASSASTSTSTPTARTPPPRPVSPASSTSSASHSTHTATPRTPRADRTGYAVTSDGISNGVVPSPSRKLSQGVPMPPSAPAVSRNVPANLSMLTAVMTRLRQNYSPWGWLFVILLPLIGLVMRLRRRHAVPQNRRVASGATRGGVGQVAAWLWQAVRDGVDMAGRGLI